MFGLAGQGLVDSMLFEQAALAQTVSRVSLKLRKEPKHLDLIFGGIGDSARGGARAEQHHQLAW